MGCIKQKLLLEFYSIDFIQKVGCESTNDFCFSVPLTKSANEF